MKRVQWETRCILLNPTLHAFSCLIPESQRPAWGSGNDLKSLSGGRCALWKKIPLDPPHVRCFEIILSNKRIRV